MHVRVRFEHTTSASFDIRPCQVLHFPPLRFGPSFSGVAMSGPWLFVVRFC